MDAAEAERAHRIVGAPDVVHDLHNWLMATMGWSGMRPRDCPHLGGVARGLFCEPLTGHHVPVLPHMERDFENAYDTCVKANDSFVRTQLSMHLIRLAFRVFSTQAARNAVKVLCEIADYVTQRGVGHPNGHVMGVAQTVYDDAVSTPPTGDVALTVAAEGNGDAVVDVVITSADPSVSGGRVFIKLPANLIGFLPRAMLVVDGGALDTGTPEGVPSTPERRHQESQPVPRRRSHNNNNNNNNSNGGKRSKRGRRSSALDESKRQRQPQQQQQQQQGPSSDVRRQWIKLFIKALLTRTGFALSSSSFEHFDVDDRGRIAFATGNGKLAFTFAQLCKQLGCDLNLTSDAVDSSLARFLVCEGVLRGHAADRTSVLFDTGLVLPNHTVASITEPTAFRPMLPLIEAALACSARCACDDDRVNGASAALSKRARANRPLLSMSIRVLARWFAGQGALHAQLLDVWDRAKALAYKESLVRRHAICVGESHVRRAVNKHVRVAIARSLWSRASSSLSLSCPSDPPDLGGHK